VAEDRPDCPFAVDIQVMQRPFFVQAGIRWVRVLQDVVAENRFLLWGTNLGQLYLRFKSELQSHGGHARLGTSHEPTDRRRQINSNVWTFPFIGVGGVVNVI